MAEQQAKLPPFSCRRSQPRGDQNYANSAVALDFDGIRLRDIASGFQFQNAIDVAVTFTRDGNVGGTKKR